MDTDFWSHFVLVPGTGDYCSCGCGRIVKHVYVGVQASDGTIYAVRCASRLGWVPSDAEAWHLAACRMPQPVQ